MRLLDKAGAQRRRRDDARARRSSSAPLTFQALTRRPVFTDLFNLTEEATIGHIQLADRADLVIDRAGDRERDRAARRTAWPTTRSRAIVLATRAPVLLAPSMNVNMWNHPLTQANVRRLVDVAGYQRRRAGRRLPRVPVDRARAGSPSRRTSSRPRRTCCRRRTSRASASSSRAGPDVRGDRSGALRRQSQLRQDGLRARGRRAAARRRGHADPRAERACRRRSA